MIKFPGRKTTYVFKNADLYERSVKFFAFPDEKFNTILYEKAIPYVKDLAYRIQVGDNHLILETTGQVKIYLRTALLFIIDGVNEVSPTEYFLNTYADITGTDKGKSLKQYLTYTALFSILLVYCLERRTFRTKSEQRRWFKQYKIKNNGIEIEARKYNTGDAQFLVDIKPDGNKATYLDCTIDKNIKSIPDHYYPLPNPGKISAFYNENTEELPDDEVNGLLQDVPFKMSRCYNNSEAMLNALQVGGYAARHSVQYYCGWVYVCYGSAISHHAWIVIDGKHVLDMSYFQDDFSIQALNTNLQGKYISFDRETYAKWIHAHVTGGKPFRGKCAYGYVENRIYAGVPSTPGQAKKAYSEIITEIPDHPEYKNIDFSNGNTDNELTKIYNSRHR